MMRRHRVFSVFGLLLLVACAPGRPGYGPPPADLMTVDPNSTATATPFQPGGTVDAVVQNIILTEMAGWTETPAPTETATPEPASPTPANTSVPLPTAPPNNNVPGGSRPLYTLYVTLDYYGHAASVTESVRYTNNTGQGLSNIVMSVEPNQWNGCFSLRELSQDGNPVGDYSLDGHRLTITLPRVLEPGSTTTFSLGYSLELPWKSGDGTFGYR
ncbi:MAG TPA: hypothetical protein VIU38_06055, partial [Anaerolineales bacterium]